MATPVDRWKGVIPAWVGIGVTWAGLFVLGVLLAPEWLTAAIVVKSVAAVTAGVVITRKLLSRNRPMLITPTDLRRR